MKKILFTLLTASIVFLSACNKKDPQINYAGTVTDVCGNTYNYVKIGSQYWMTENLRCNKYDSKSTRSGATIGTSGEAVFTPFYTNASDRSTWTSDAFAGKLKDADISKFGYLYNWAAAVGIEDGQSQNQKFSTAVQGICPNGWHVPSSQDWNTLINCISAETGTTSEAGKQLKSVQGWYNNSNGTNTYGMSVLPAGLAAGKQNGDKYALLMGAAGNTAYFWTTNPIEVKFKKEQKEDEGEGSGDEEDSEREGDEGSEGDSESTDDEQPNNDDEQNESTDDEQSESDEEEDEYAIEIEGHTYNGQTDFAASIHLTFDNNGIFSPGSTKDKGLSVRCVKD